MNEEITPLGGIGTFQKGADKLRAIDVQDMTTSVQNNFMTTAATYIQTQEQREIDRIKESLNNIPGFASFNTLEGAFKEIYNFIEKQNKRIGELEKLVEALENTL